jgi:protein-S-isoprenylcysteine O-methyltransferase Ste14
MTDSFVLTSSNWPYLAIPAGITVLSGAILINFLLYRPEEERRAFQPSSVDTLSMSLFAFGAAGLITVKWGFFNPGSYKGMLQLLGILIFYGGILINLLGRKWLGANWSDQIRIRQTHALVQTGIYRWIRHPLYASTIGMLLGAGLVYTNGLVLIFTLLAFVPMMIFRARQEETQLLRTFPEYSDYRLRAGMFLPRIIKRRIP